LGGGCGAECARQRRPADEIGMGADERDLLLLRRGIHHVAERLVESFHAGERALRPRLLHYPWRTLEYAAESGHEGGAVKAVELTKGDVLCRHGARSDLHSTDVECLHNSTTLGMSRRG